MKKITIILAAVFTVTTAQAQITERLTFTTSVGTGIAMSAPSHTPLTWQAAGYYNFNERFSAGVGAGLSFYEKMLVPLFADVRFNITKPQKFTPYLVCRAGYGFAPDKNAIGGSYSSPQIGLQYSLGGSKKLFCAVGYELQKLERLKTGESPHLKAEFAEQLSHHSVSLKIGFMF
jgi:hypothetical protein